MSSTTGRSSSPTLSVCCVTNGPVPQVAALLSLLRPVADEIVVVVDDSVPLAAAQPILELADVAFTHPVGPVGAERVLGWVHGECTGDWILRIDSDEVPFAAFLDAIPHLVQSSDVLQYLVPRRWCFPDPSHWLDERPWAPDWQCRLARNLPGLRFDPEPWHAGLARRDPHRHVLTPLYHLDCATTPKPARARKTELYESLRPDHATEDGVNVNAYYLPERYATRPPVAVPPEDHALIQRLLDGVVDVTSRSGHRPARAQPVTTAETDRRWPFRAVPESAHKATLDVVERLPQLRAGATTSVTVRVANQGTEIWPYGNALPEFRLAHRWERADDRSFRHEGPRTGFTADVSPGDEIVQPMTIAGPTTPGEYRLVLDVVHEHVGWLDCGPTLAVTVAP